MPNPAKQIEEKRSFEDSAREVCGRLKLGDVEYASKFVATVMDAFCRVLKDPDIEVRVSFDSVTELHEACEMVGSLIVRFKAGTLVDWEKSSDGKDRIEFLNGSALRLIGPGGDLYLQKKPG